MYLTSLAIILFILAAFLAWRQFRLALAGLCLLLPAYLIRLNFGLLPSTVLEVLFGAVFLVWLIKYGRSDSKQILSAIKKNKLFFILIGVFVLASILGILASDMWWASLGQWRAYFLEPVLVFIMIIGRRAETETTKKDEISANDLIWFLGLSTISVSLLAILQKFSGFFFPPSLWDAELNGRVTSFFTTPNAIGLFIGPVLPLLLAVWPSASKNKKIFILAVVFLGLVAIFLSFSQGAWVALAAALLVGLCLFSYKKWAIALVLVGSLMIIGSASLRSAVFFEDKSGVNRLRLWSDTVGFLSVSPKNFVFGAGIRQFFRKVEKPLYNPVEMERLIYPHNLFLNFWSETGLLGLLSFAGIYIWLMLRAVGIFKKNRYWGAALLMSLTYFLIHGLVDVPYFKNDLALLWWLIVAVIFIV